MVEGRQAEGLPLRVVPQVCLKAEAFKNGQKGFDDEDGGARLGHICSHVAPPLCQDIVDGCDAVCSSKRQCERCSTALRLGRVAEAW